MKPLGFGIITLVLSGCMMAMHGGMYDAQQKPIAAKTVEKEFAEKDISLSLYSPPLSAGWESTVTLKASRSSTGKPITGAKAVFLVERMRDVDGQVVSSVEYKAAEISGEGVYQLRYTPAERAIYRITASFRVEEGVETMPLTIALNQEASSMQYYRANRYVTPMVLIGGAMMVAMMLIIAF